MEFSNDVEKCEIEVTQNNPLFFYSVGAQEPENFVCIMYGGMLCLVELLK